MVPLNSISLILFFSFQCYWDRWINQYTVHIFKCPVHLVYDEYITACNWPFDGPTCVPHEAIKLYAQTE